LTTARSIAPDGVWMFIVEFLFFTGDGW